MKRIFFLSLSAAALIVFSCTKETPVKEITSVNTALDQADYNTARPGGAPGATIRGEVLPAEANAIVMAINGTDTARAIPDDITRGFKFTGLAAGIYRIEYKGRNHYSDTTLPYIRVASSTELQLPLVTLYIRP
jgi:hypothetical protein